jgi:LacI family transcriptional regulator
MNRISIAVLGPVNFEHANAMLTGVKDYARHRSWNVIPLHYSQNIALENLIAEHRIQGIIGDLLSDRWVQSLRGGQTVALVHTGGQSVLRSVSGVCSDDRASGILAASHFIGRQYRHLYFAGLGEGDASARDKQDGFTGKAAEAGIAAAMFPSLCLTGPLQEWVSFVKSLPMAAAVFCQDDGTARRVIACCQQAGRPVPGTVSIIGTGNSALDSFLAGVGISSIMTDYTTLGAEAARLAARALVDPGAPPLHIRIPPAGLVLHETTGIGALNSIVGRAMDFMEKQIAAPISVTQIARHVNASRRLVELRFRETLGRSPHEELVRLRMARARELLADPRIAIRVIAERCGYPEPAHFYARFKQHHDGTPPAAWRRGTLQPTA